MYLTLPIPYLTYNLSHNKSINDLTFLNYPMLEQMSNTANVNHSTQWCNIRAILQTEMGEQGGHTENQLQANYV